MRPHISATCLNPTWGVRDGFFPLFPICSHQIPIKYPKGSPSSQVVTQDVPNRSLDYSHMVCPKFNCDVYKVHPQGNKHICFCFDWVPKRCIYWGVHNIPKELMMGQSIWPLRKQKFWVHPWIHTYMSHSTRVGTSSFYIQVTLHLLPYMMARAKKFPRRENKLAIVLNLDFVLGKTRC
jgi:hypothetical protein